MTCPKAFRAMRRSLGWSQGYVGSLIGVSAMTISKFEAGWVNHLSEEKARKAYDAMRQREAA